MPGPRSKRPVHLKVTGPAPLPPWCRARWLIGSPPGSVILDENVTAERPPRRRRGGTSREEGQKGVSSSGSMLSWTTAAA